MFKSAIVCMLFVICACPLGARTARTVSVAPVSTVSSLTPMSAEVILNGTVAAHSSHKVPVLGGTSFTVSAIAANVLADPRKQKAELDGARSALTNAPELVETFTETQAEAVFTSRLSFTVKDPSELRRKAPHFRNYRKAYKGHVNFSSSDLEPGPRKNFDKFRREMAHMPKGHPLRGPARKSDDALLQTIMAGKGDVVITTSVTVPKKRPSISGKSAKVPSLKNDSLSYTCTQARTYDSMPVTFTIR